MSEKNDAVEVLRDELNYYLDGKITERKHNVQELTESLRKACLALEENKVNRKEIIDLENKINVLLNQQNESTKDFGDKIISLMKTNREQKEKLDKLEKWLNKEVELIETTQEEHQNQVLWEQLKLQFIKEVREALENGKQ